MIECLRLFGESLPFALALLAELFFFDLLHFLLSDLVDLLAGFGYNSIDGTKETSNLEADAFFR